MGWVEWHLNTAVYLLILSSSDSDTWGPHVMYECTSSTQLL
jgi:hypothetical protein